MSIAAPCASPRTAPYGHRQPERTVLEREDAQAMGAWDHGGGVSLDASVRIEAKDREGLGRLLRQWCRCAGKQTEGRDKRINPGAKLEGLAGAPQSRV